MIYWNYNLDTEKPPSYNVKSLLDILHFRNLEFITKQSFPKEELPTDEYEVTDVSMTGTVAYVKSCLRDSLTELQNYLEFYVESDESYETKTYDLLTARLYIKEFFLSNSIHNPVLLDLNFTFNLNNTEVGEPIIVRLDQCKLTEEAHTAIQQHLHLRESYIGLLDKYLALSLDKINLSIWERKIKTEEENHKKEVGLLDVWVGLKEAGFMDFLSEDKIKLSEHRKRFFELFQLTDRNYNYRNKSIKIKKDPSEFLEILVKLLKDYYKKKG